MHKGVEDKPNGESKENYGKSQGTGDTKPFKQFVEKHQKVQDGPDEKLIPKGRVGHISAVADRIRRDPMDDIA